MRTSRARTRAAIAAAVWLGAGAWVSAEEPGGSLDSLLEPAPSGETPTPDTEAEERAAGPSAAPATGEEREAPEAAAPPAPAPAPPGGPRPREIEEIVVTARKTEENIQDVPIAVTALSGEDLEQTSTFEMRDLGLRVPNMLVRQGPAQSTALVFQIRGQIQNDILGTLDPSIGFYDDGVYVARPHGANAAFVDVRSVQVLRGPQGTLFGRNTTGGAVLLSTNDPDFEAISGSVGATLGSFERRAFRGVLNVPLLDDTLAFRVAGQSTSTDGFAVDETNRRDIATDENRFVRAKLLYRPWENLSVLLAGQYVDVDQLGYPVKAAFALEPGPTTTDLPCCLAFLNATAEGVDYESFTGGDVDRTHYDSGLDPFNQLTVKSLTLTTVWDQPWASVRFIAGWRENDDVANRIDIDGSPSKIVDTVQANQNFQQSYELQLTGTTLAERLGWAAGVVYFDESGEERGTTFALVPLASVINPILTPGDIDNDSLGIYAQGTYELLPKLRMTGGVRHSRDGKRLVLRAMMGSQCAVPEEMRDDPATCQGTFDDSFSNTSFLLGSDYRLFEDFSIFDDLLIYASVTTGYRAGGQNLRGTSVPTLQPFDEETLMQLEAGFKSDLLGRRVRLNAAGFHTFYDDIQRSVIVASSGVLPATVVSNAADAEVSGAELELAALPGIEGLEVGGFFGLALPRYNEFMDVTGDRSDEKFDAVAETSYSLSGAYTREVLGVPWLNRLDWSWTDEIPFAQGNIAYFRNQGFDIERLVTQPAVGILNFRSAVSLRNGLELGFFGRNLTDERTFGALALGGGPDFVVQLINNAPREFGGDVTFRF